MRRTTKPSLDRKCQKCAGEIPAHKRLDATYCSIKCRNAAEKSRYCSRNPEYVKRQRRQVKEVRHLKTYGHTEYIDNPVGNPKDRYRVARSLGYRSMLEVNVARQLKELGVSFEYEPIKIPYVKEEVNAS